MKYALSFSHKQAPKSQTCQTVLPSRTVKLLYCSDPFAIKRKFLWEISELIIFLSHLSKQYIHGTTSFDSFLLSPSFSKRAAPYIRQFKNEFSRIGISSDPIDHKENIPLPLGTFPLKRSYVVTADDRKSRVADRNWRVDYSNIKGMHAGQHVDISQFDVFANHELFSLGVQGGLLSGYKFARTNKIRSGRHSLRSLYNHRNYN